MDIFVFHLAVGSNVTDMYMRTIDFGLVFIFEIYYFLRFHQTRTLTHTQTYNYMYIYIYMLYNYEYTCILNLCDILRMKLQYNIYYFNFGFEREKTLFQFWFDTKYDEISKQREITNANVKLCVNTPSNEEILKMFYQIFWVGIFSRCLFSASFHNYNGLYEIWRATSSKSVDKTDGRRSKIEALNLQPCEKYR